MGKIRHDEVTAGEAAAGFLLACVSGRAAAENVSPPGDFDWDLFARTAAWHSCIPQAYIAMKSLAGVPPTVRASLRAQFIGNSLQNLIKARELTRLTALLSASGIETIAFKGPALAVAAYGNLKMRQFSDLDILVRRQDVVGAVELLEREHYMARRFRAHRAAESLRRYSEDEFVSQNRELMVDLHWELTPPHFPFGPKADTVWARTSSVEIEGAEIRTLGPMDSFLFLCVHHSKHGWVSLRWVMDLAQMLSTRTGLATPAMLEQAGHTGCLRMLLLGLNLARDLAATPLDEPMARACENDPAMRRLAHRIEARMFRKLNVRPSLFNDWVVPLRSVQGNRIRYLARRALWPTINDREFLSLPQALAPLYLLLRPFRLGLQQGRRLFGDVPARPPQRRKNVRGSNCRGRTYPA